MLPEADAAADGPGADVEDLGLDVGAVQLLRNEGQSGVGAAFLVGAAVDEQDFHTLNLSFWPCAPEQGALCLDFSTLAAAVQRGP